VNFVFVNHTQNKQLSKFFVC